MKTIYGVPIAILLGTILNAWIPSRLPVPRREATPSEITEVFKLLSSRQEVARMAATHRLLDVHFTFKSGPSSAQQQRNGRIVETQVFFGWSIPHPAPDGGFIDEQGQG